MSAFKNYNKEIHREFGYHATWTPGVPLKLGDVGVLVDGVFRQESTLADFGISDFNTRQGSVLEDYKFDSKSGVSIALKASGEAAPANSQLGEAEAGFSIDFSKDFAVVFRAHAPQEHVITNSAQIGAKIVELYEKGEWKKDYVVVTNMVQAASATVIISGEKGGHIDISASGKSEVAEADLANIDAGLDVKWSSNISEKIIAKSSTTPLYRLHGIKKGWFSGGKFIALKAADGLSEEEKSGLEEGHGFGHIEFDDID